MMTGKSLPRRTLLRGLGATVALPFLDAMLPPLRAAAKPVHRFQAFYVPNGMAMEYWSPKGEGTAFELSPILEPLAPFRNQMLVLSGIKANWNYIHAGASGSFLTGATHGGRNEVEIVADVSMDQLLARRFGKETQVASLELSMDAPANAGACTGNLSCVTHTRSRGVAPRSLCRWSGIRARCSRSCLATAAARSGPRGTRDCGSTRAFWTRWPGSWRT